MFFISFFFKNLLASNQFGSISSDSFFASIPLPSATVNGAGITTKSFMDTWILQKNYPEVAVLLGTSAGKSRVVFRQARYLVSEFDVIGEPDQPK